MAFGLCETIFNCNEERSAVVEEADLVNETRSATCAGSFALPAAPK